MSTDERGKCLLLWKGEKIVGIESVIDSHVSGNRKIKKELNERKFEYGRWCGGPREDRTPNPLIKSQLLCQLSYRPEELIAGIS